MTGFIGLDRGILEHWIYKDAEHLKVWIEMLFRARFAKEPGTVMVEGQLVEIEYSQFIFGRIKWSERLGISERRLRTLVDKLVADGMIQLVRRAPKFSVYCVTNYAKYRPSNDHQESLEQQGIEGYGDHHNVQQATSKRPASDQQATTKEQSKQRKQGNKVLKDYPQDAIVLTTYLIDLMKQNNPNAKIPTNLDKWYDEMDKIQRIDQYDYMQIQTAIYWCQNDNFWKGNILSVPKLRAKMDTLIVQMQRKPQVINGGQARKETAFERMQRIAEEERQYGAVGNH